MAASEQEAQAWMQRTYQDPEFQQLLALQHPFAGESDAAYAQRVMDYNGGRWEAPSYTLLHTYMLNHPRPDGWVYDASGGHPGIRREHVYDSKYFWPLIFAAGAGGLVAAPFIAGALAADAGAAAGAAGTGTISGTTAATGVGTGLSFGAPAATGIAATAPAASFAATAPAAGAIGSGALGAASFAPAAAGAAGAGGGGAAAGGLSPFWSKLIGDNASSVGQGLLSIYGASKSGQTRLNKARAAILEKLASEYERTQPQRQGLEQAYQNRLPTYMQPLLSGGQGGTRLMGDPNANFDYPIFPN